VAEPKARIAEFAHEVERYRSYKNQCRQDCTAGFWTNCPAFKTRTAPKAMGVEIEPALANS
jgi:hypothetical protein